MSKTKRILEYLEENSGEAFFSVEIVEALAEYEANPGDVMSNVRRYER